MSFKQLIVLLLVAVGTAACVTTPPRQKPTEVRYWDNLARGVNDVRGQADE